MGGWLGAEGGQDGGLNFKQRGERMYQAKLWATQVFIHVPFCSC